MKGVLAICIVILGLNFVVGYDPDELDDQTGCPKVFKKNDRRGLCKCGKQRYHVGSFQKEEAYVVNCTNTR